MFRLPGVLLSLKVKFVKPLMIGSAKVGAPGTSTSPVMLIVPLAPWSMIQVEIPVMFTLVTVSLPLKLARSSLLFAAGGGASEGDPVSVGQRRVIAVGTCQRRIDEHPVGRDSLRHRTYHR